MSHETFVELAEGFAVGPCVTGVDIYRMVEGDEAAGWMFTAHLDDDEVEAFVSYVSDGD